MLAICRHWTSDGPEAEALEDKHKLSPPRELTNNSHPGFQGMPAYETTHRVVPRKNSLAGTGVKRGHRPSRSYDGPASAWLFQMLCAARRHAQKLDSQKVSRHVGRVNQPYAYTQQRASTEPKLRRSRLRLISAMECGIGRAPRCGRCEQKTKRI